jgi:hypothetical protein
METNELVVFFTKSLELHGTSRDLVEKLDLDACDKTDLSQFMLDMKPKLVEVFNGDEIHSMSILNTMSQLMRLESDFNKIYPNFSSPPINVGNLPEKSVSPKKKTTSKVVKPTIELPVKISWDVDTSIPVKDFIEACRTLESAGKGVGYPVFESEYGWKKGKIDNVVNKATGLTASQFVRNKVWKAENIKN